MRLSKMGFGSLVLSLLITLGCEQKESASSHPDGLAHDVTASATIADSFSVQNVKPSSVFRDLKPSDRAKIRLNKSALEKEFLWSAQLITQLTVPQFSGLKSRVVAFRLIDDQLYMLESTQGHTVTNDLPQTLVLAKFPVTNQDETSIEFDFNKGMQEVYVAGDWRASDLDGAVYQAENEFVSINLAHSYVHSATLNSRQELVIVQRGQIRQDIGMGNINTPLETRFTFKPYSPNPNFSPLETVDFDRMGFFEVAPLLGNSGETRVYASRFDPAADKPIVYSISANTPEEFKQAVRDGVLYWNKAFGYEKVKVIDAPAGVSAPDSEYNVVQWINWDGAGFAYADAQMDPRNGEIQHAQVFLTSAFAFSSRIRAQTLMRKFKPDAVPKKILSLANIAPSVLCDRHEAEHFNQALANLAAANLPDERILEISRDYVREVVAHEVGHTLGLRHNFAGNLSANFDISELDGLFEDYVKNLKIRPGLIATSSVMEYQDFPSSAMSGRKMTLASEAAGPYDLKAIATLYKGQPLVAQDTPLFCTDSHANSMSGCTVWDQGPSPLANAVYVSQKVAENVPYQLLETIIKLKTQPLGIDRKTIDQIALNPKAAASSLLLSRSAVLAALSEDFQDLRVNRSFSKLDGLNRDAVAHKTLETHAAEIERLGGLKNLLAEPSPALAANWLEKFNQLIDSPEYQKGVGYDEKPYELSADEVTSAKKLAADYFAQVQKALALADVKSLVPRLTLANQPLSDELANILMTRALNYLLSESGEVLQEKVNFGSNKTAILRLPIYKYDQDVRAAAASLLMGKSAEALDWGLVEHMQVKKTFTEKLKVLLQNNEIMTIRAEDNSRAVAKWLLENRAIVMTLMSRD